MYIEKISACQANHCLNTMYLINGITYNDLFCVKKVLYAFLRFFFLTDQSQEPTTY